MSRNSNKCLPGSCTVLADYGVRSNTNTVRHLDWTKEFSSGAKVDVFSNPWRTTTIGSHVDAAVNDTALTY